MCCSKISLIDSPTDLPASWYNSNGGISLDIFTESTYSKDKKRIELTELQTITGSGTLGQTLPPTAKNNAIFKALCSKNNFNSKVSMIPVNVYEGGSVSKQDGLKYIRCNPDGSHEIQIVDRSNDWRNDLEGCDICELFEGMKYDITKGFVLDNWANDKVWDRTNRPFHLSVWDIGNFLQPDTVSVSDLIPELSLCYILESAFCKIGWQLKSPHLNSEEGKRLYIVALKENWFENATGDAVNPLVKGKGELDVDFVFTDDSDGLLDFDNVFGSGSLYVGNTSSFGGLYGKIYNPFDFDIPFVEICFSGRMVYAGQSVAFVDLVLEKNDGTGWDDFETTSLQVSGTGLPVSTSTKVPLPMDCIFRFKVVTADDFDITIEQGACIEVKNCTKQPLLGDTVILSNMLDCEVNALDLLKGYLHVINGKLDIDCINRCITIHVPEQTTLCDGTTIKGFHDDSNPIDLRGKSICNSTGLTVNDFNSDRYLRLCFKDSTDSYINELGLDEPIYSKTIDRGEGQGFNEKVKEDCNPIFEPTETKQLDQAYSNGVAPVVPVLWDNTEGNLTTNSGVRLVYHFGCVIQITEAGGAGARPWNFEGNIELEIPFSAVYSDAIFAGNNCNIAYGENPTDNYERFYRQQFNDEQESAKMTGSLMIDNCTFENFSFRRPILTTQNGCDVIIRINEITGFEKCNNQPTGFEGYIKSQLKCS